MFGFHLLDGRLETLVKANGLKAEHPEKTLVGWGI